MLVNSYGFIFIYICIHVDTLSAHTQKSELQYKYWYKFHFFSSETINIVKQILALHGLPFLSHVQYFYSLYNKSYLFTQFLFYGWQSLCLVQLLYFGDNNLILLPMFLLYKIQLNIDISKFGGPRKNFEISGCSRYPKSKFFDSISVFVFVLTC